MVLVCLGVVCVAMRGVCPIAAFQHRRSTVRRPDEDPSPRMYVHGYIRRTYVYIDLVRTSGCFAFLNKTQLQLASALIVTYR